MLWAEAKAWVFGFLVQFFQNFFEPRHVLYINLIVHQEKVLKDYSIIYNNLLDLLRNYSV